MLKTSLKSFVQNALESYQENILLEDDQASWSGRELSSHLLDVIKIIRKNSLPQSRVGICFHNSVAQGIAVIACILADRVPVMINCVDILESKLDWIRHAKLNFVIVSEDLSEKISTVHLVLNEKGLIKEVVGKASIIAELDQVLFMPPLGTGVVLFTSGSTGEPKEVYVPEKGMLKSIHDLINKFNLSSKTVASITLPVCHSMALNTQFLPTFMVGGKSRFYNIRLSMNKVFRNMLKDKSTFVSLIGEVVRTCWEEKKQRILTPALDVAHVQLAGGLITAKHLDMTKELFPNAIIHKGYGLTEAIRVTMISSQDKNFSTTAVGKPMSFLDVVIKDEAGFELKSGKLGQIFVRGDSVMLGLRSLTSMETKLVSRKHYLPTGDLGYVDEMGYLHVTGRLDSLFKINGKRVAGAEIEKMALESSPRFRFAKAILVSNEDDDRHRIILFIELDRASWKDGALNLDEETQQLLAQRMKMLSVPPKEIIFTPHIPRTSNGKLNLPKLKQIWKIQSFHPIEKKIPANLNLFSINEGLFA